MVEDQTTPTASFESDNPLASYDRSVLSTPRRQDEWGLAEESSTKGLRGRLGGGRGESDGRDAVSKSPSKSDGSAARDNSRRSLRFGLGDNSFGSPRKSLQMNRKRGDAESLLGKQSGIRRSMQLLRKGDANDEPVDEILRADEARKYDAQEQGVERKSLKSLFAGLDQDDVLEEERFRGLRLRRSIDYKDAAGIFYQVDSLKADASNWKRLLTRIESACMRKQVLEPAFLWELTELARVCRKKGQFECSSCQHPLYSTDHFELLCGWPVFYRGLDRAVTAVFTNRNGKFVAQIFCHRCDAFLGYRIDPDNRGTKVDCVNSAAIIFTDNYNSPKRGVRALFSKRRH